MASADSAREHSAHSHSHSHSLGIGHHHHHSPAENIYLTSKNKHDAGVRITRIGLLVNLLMAISKGLGGWYFHSQALVADAMHALTDLVSDFLTLSTVALALKKPTEHFPNGYGKFESLGGLGVSGLLLVGGLVMGYNALLHIYAEIFVENAAEFLAHTHSHSHSHSHSHVDLGPNINAAWLALGSIIVKEWLYRATMKIALERKSSILASNAVHHRIDSLTSVVALCAIGGSHFLKNATWLDPVGGLLVSMMVVNAGLRNTRVALLELSDVGLDHEVKDAVQDTLKNAGVEGIKSISGVKSGQNYLIEITVEVDPLTTVSETTEYEERIRSILASPSGRTRARGIKRVKVRFVKKGAGVGPSEFLEQKEGVEVAEGNSHVHSHSREHFHEAKKSL